MRCRYHRRGTAAECDGLVDGVVEGRHNICPRNIEQSADNVLKCKRIEIMELDRIESQLINSLHCVYYIYIQDEIVLLGRYLSPNGHEPKDAYVGDISS